MGGENETEQLKNDEVREYCRAEWFESEKDAIDR